jgi:hypothetical protein
MNSLDCNYISKKLTGKKNEPFRQWPQSNHGTFLWDPSYPHGVEIATTAKLERSSKR